MPARYPAPGDWKDEAYREEWNRQAKLYEQACEDLSEWLGQQDPHAVFKGLFSLACSQFNPFESFTTLPAHLLLYLKPPCPISCKEAVRQVSRSEWDLSLEEVPWYVADCFGTDAIYQSLDELEAEDDIQEFRKVEAAWVFLNSGPMPLSKYLEAEKERPRHSAEVRLDTIRYWTDILVKDQKGILENWHPFWWRGDKPSASG